MSECECERGRERLWNHRPWASEWILEHHQCVAIIMYDTEYNVSIS